MSPAWTPQARSYCADGVVRSQNGAATAASTGLELWWDWRVSLPARPPDDEPDNRRLRDFAGTVVLLMVQGFLWRATLLLTDGNPTPMPHLGLVLFLATIAVAVFLLIRKRPAARVAIGGCLLQLGLAVVGISA